MADARCAMYLNGTFLRFVYRTKPRRHSHDYMKLPMSRKPHVTKYSDADGEVTRFLKFGT